MELGRMAEMMPAGIPTTMAIRIAAPAKDSDPLSALIDFALSETSEARGGERTLLMRLSELMFIEVLRRYLRENRQPGN